MRGARQLTARRARRATVTWPANFAGLLASEAAVDAVQIYELAYERTVVVVVSGELDVLALPTLAGRLNEITERGPERLVFDLAGVRFMDCAAARVIVHAGSQLPGGRRTVIRSATPAVRRLLALTGLDADCSFDR